MIAMATSIELAARAGLARELALEAKPGLVTPSSRGSHADMDHFTFAASIDSLTGYFADCARLGACGCAFNDLQARGREAEKAMFAATGGVNTHKGAVFTMGLLSAAAGRQIADGRSVRDEHLGVTVARRWGAAILIAGSAADSDIPAAPMVPSCALDSAFPARASRRRPAFRRSSRPRCRSCVRRSRADAMNPRLERMPFWRRWRCCPTQTSHIAVASPALPGHSVRRRNFSPTVAFSAPTGGLASTGSDAPSSSAG